MSDFYVLDRTNENESEGLRGLPDFDVLLGYPAFNPNHNRPPPPRQNESYIVERFVPPTPDATPQTLFAPGINDRAIPSVTRFIRRDNAREFLIYTDGACLDNGKESPRAGWSFVFRPATAEHKGVTELRLEQKGPTGESHPQTSNRAELRAVIAALQFRQWDGERWTRLMIATDSEYVVKGATEWSRKWLQNGWRTSGGKPVMNRDLWDVLFDRMATLRERGLQVRLWHIPRELNTEADKWAKKAAAGSDIEAYRKINGILV